MRTLIVTLAPLLFLVLIFAILFRPTRSRGRDAVRRGIERVNFLGWPSRDREVASGALLLIFASVTLSEVVLDAAAADPRGDLAVAAAVLGAVVAIGFAFSPTVTKTAMGAVALTVVATERLGGTGCAADATAFQNWLWLISGLTLTASVFVLSAVFSFFGFAQPSSYREERPIGSRLIGCAGALELLNLLLRPEGLDALGEELSGTPMLLGFVTACLLIVVAGLAALPHFTASVMGIGVGVAGGFLLTVENPPCRDIGMLLVIATSFFLVWILARRLRH